MLGYYGWGYHVTENVVFSMCHVQDGVGCPKKPGEKGGNKMVLGCAPPLASKLVAVPATEPYKPFGMWIA